MEQFQNHWYSWGVWAALSMAVLAAVWIFIHANRRGSHVMIWQVMTVLAIVLILPSALLVIPDLQNAYRTALTPAMWLGIGAFVIALAAVLLDALGIGASSTNQCAQCGRSLDAQWVVCPYCGFSATQMADSTIPVYQPVPSVHSTITPSPMPVPFIQSDAPTQEIKITPAVVQPPTDERAPANPGETEPLHPDGEVLPSTRPTEETRIIGPALPSTTLLAYLVIRSGVHEGKTFQIGAALTIGRKAETNDVVLDEDDMISREHARISLERDKFILLDLASSNGTFVQDRETREWNKIHKYTLEDGDMIKIGTAILSFMEI